MIKEEALEPVAWINGEMLSEVKTSKILTRCWLYHRETPADEIPLVIKNQAEAYARHRVQEVQQWRPIESAPMDGTRILLWATPYSMILPDSTEIVGSYQRGWTTQTGVPLSHVTLWMPLPPKPQ